MVARRLAHVESVYFSSFRVELAQLDFTKYVDVAPFMMDRYGIQVDVLAKNVVVRGKVDSQAPSSSYSLIMYPFGNALLVVEVGGTMLGNALHVDL